jgi:AraC-like DNA-binding protein
MRMATHIAPRTATPALRDVPLISVNALAGIPAFIRSAFGERLLRKACHAAMLDIEIVEDSHCFVPQRVMTTFAEAVARMAGEEHFGLKLAPYVEVERYGDWGEYLLGGTTLGSAIRRTAATMGFHARGDAMSLDVVGAHARIGYASAARGLPGYPHVAFGTLGAIASLCRAYLPAHWRPHRVEVDVPMPRQRTISEDIFECPVLFGAPKLAVWLDAKALRSTAHRPPERVVTTGDLRHARGELHRMPGVAGVVSQQVWAQILTGNISIASTAMALDTSVRTLQRELNREGVDFRTVVNVLRTRRAVELLGETAMSVTRISTMLGYSAPAHFARAFRKSMGVGPGDFRKRQRMGAPI